MGKFLKNDPNILLFGWQRPARQISLLICCSFLFLILLTNTHCKVCCIPSLPNVLPPATQEGKNTFGCKINGVVWLPLFSCFAQTTGNCNALGFSIYPLATLSRLPIAFTLSARRQIYDTTFSMFNMYTGSSRITKAGNVTDSVTIIYFEGANEFSYFPPVQTSGAFDITKLDTVNSIISGTFHFTLYNSKGDSVVVTDGRFDLTYNACLCQ